MKKLKYLLFLLIVIITPNVFASNTNVSNQIKYSVSSSKGTYQGDEIYLGGYNGQFSIGTRYNGRLSMVSFYLNTSDYNFSPSHTYTITLNMATEDWRNNFMGPQVIQANSNGTLQSNSSLTVSNFRFVSYKQIKFNFKTSSNLPPYYFFRLYSTDYASTNTTAITGVNNWNLSSIYINDNVSATPTPAPVTPTPSPTPQPNNQDIINNANQNTNDIINNANQNNQNLIDNANQNTTDIIENNNSNTQTIVDTLMDNNFSNCSDGYRSFLIGSDKSYISSQATGKISSNNNYFVTAPIRINDNTSYELNLIDATGIQYGYYCFYNKYNVKLGNCTKYDDNTTTTYTFTSPENAYFVRFTLYRSNNVITNAYLKGYTCVTSSYENNVTSQKQLFATNATNDFLMDNSNPNISDNDFLNTFNSVGVNDPLSYLLTLPTQLINKIVSLSDTCSTINLGTLYGVMISLPCINLENYLGSSVWNIIDVIFSVSLLVIIFKNLYDTFSNLLTMGAEKEAKEKFSMPTPMDFLSMILGGDR